MTARLTLTVLALTIVEPGALAAQPGTDIFLGTVGRSEDRLRVTSLQNVTDRDGYDNQPSFTPDGRAILYTSGRPDGQTDIYRYDIASGTTTRVTATPESEYSPTPMPNGGAFSVIQVEADSTQRLWHFGLDGTVQGVVFADVRPVGYHAWANENVAALFVLGSPSTLQLADRRAGSATVVERNIGRSLHRVPNAPGEVSFLHKVSDTEWVIKRLNVRSRATTPVATMPGQIEDYAWLSDRHLITGRGSELLRWDSRGNRWISVADLSRFGINGITRLAANPAGDRIAIVGNR